MAPHRGARVSSTKFDGEQTARGMLAEAERSASLSEPQLPFYAAALAEGTASGPQVTPSA